MSAKAKRRKPAQAKEKSAPRADVSKVESADPNGPSGSRPEAVSPYLPIVCALLIPGGGHFLLGRRGRALAFFVLISLALAFGLYLDGFMPWVWQGSPLRTLATLACLGNLIAYPLLRFGFGFEGDVQAPGYDYGSAFILTAGLMNLLLILDVWDIARGDKE